MERNSRIPQSKDVLFCRKGSNTVPGFRLRKLQRGHRIPLCLQYVVCLLTAVCSLSVVVSCHPPSTGVQELWAAWGSGQCLFGDKVKGNPSGTMWRGTHQPLGRGTSLTGEPGVEPEGEGPKDYEINSKSWIFFDLPKCMYFMLMKY